MSGDREFRGWEDFVEANNRAERLEKQFCVVVGAHAAIEEELIKLKQAIKDVEAVVNLKHVPIALEHRLEDLFKLVK